MDCEFIETQKGGRALLSGGYRYLKEVQATQPEGSAYQRQNVSRTSFNKQIS